jgi:hypothetical protein
MITFEQLANKARKLLKDPRATGNHGFKGEQLRAWKELRSAIKDALRSAIKDALTFYSLTYIRARTAKCPRVVSNRDVHVHGIGNKPCKDGKNPNWSNGTRGGANWTEDSQTVLIDIVNGNYSG